MKRMLLAVGLAAVMAMMGCSSEPPEVEEQAVSGGFREQAIQLPEDFGGYMNMTAHADGSVTLYGASDPGSGYSAQGWQGEICMVTVQPDGTVEEQPVPWQDQLEQICSDAPRAVSLATDEEGTLYLMASLHRNAQEEEPFLLFREENGALEPIPVDLSGSSLTEETSITDQVCTLSGVSQGYLFVMDNAMNWGILDTNGNLCNQSQDPLLLPGQTRSALQVSAVRNGYVWAGSNEYDVAYTLPDFKSDGDLSVENGQIFPDWEGDGFYHLSMPWEGERQLSHYTLHGETREILMQGSDYVWGLPGSFSHGCVTPDGVLWLCVSESGNEQLYRYVYDSELTVERTLTIFSLEEDSTVRQTIAAWNTDHPETRIEYTVGMANADQTGITEEDVIRQINAELLAGGGPDLLILDGLSSDSLIEQGVLTDLSGLGDWSAVRSNLLSGFAKEDELYAVPTGFSACIAGGRPDQVDDRLLSLQGLADAVQAMPGTSDSGDCCLALDHALYEQIFDLFYPASADAIWKDGSFCPEAYQAFAEQIRRMAASVGAETIRGYNLRNENQQGTSGEERYAMGPISVLNDFWNGRGRWFVAQWDRMGAEFSRLDRDAQGRLTGSSYGEVTLYPMPGISEQGTCMLLTSAALPRNRTENQDLALEFLRLMLSDEIQGSAALNGLPVTRSGLDAAAERVRQTDPFGITNDVNALLDSLQPVQIDPVLQAAARSAAADWYDGELTADAACDQVRQEAALRLAEQS